MENKENSLKKTARLLSRTEQVKNGTLPRLFLLDLSRIILSLVSEGMRFPLWMTACCRMQQKIFLED